MIKKAIAFRYEIEQDALRFRWSFYSGDARLAKSAGWWNSREEAQADADAFAIVLDEARGK
jgi:hypothetical protein